MEENVTALSTEDAELLELGGALGQQQTLAAVAGRCTAAQAATLARLREQKLYKRCAPTWEEFCTAYLKTSRAEADRLIRLLQEFGPGYFQVAELTRISAETYRGIASSVKDGMLHYDGDAIEILPENARRVAAAVAEMRRALPAPAKGGRTAADRVAALDRRCTEVMKELHDLLNGEHEGAYRRELDIVLQRWNSELQRVAAAGEAPSAGEPSAVASGDVEIGTQPQCFLVLS